MKKFLFFLTTLLILSACASVVQRPSLTPITALTKQVAIATNTILPTKAPEPTPEPLMVKVSEFGQGIVFDHDISPDRKQIAVGSSGGLYIYDANTKEILRHFTANALESILKVMYSPNGEYIAYESIPSDSKVYITVIQTSNEKVLLRTAISYTSNHIAFSQDNKYLLAIPAIRGYQVGCNSSIEVWNVQSGQKIKSLSPPSNTNVDQYSDCLVLNKAVISQDDQLIFSGFDGGLVAWNLNTGEQKYYTPAYSGSITTILFDPVKNTVVTGDSGGAIRYWDSTTGKNFRTISALGKNINSIKLSDDNKQLIVTMDDGLPVAFEYLTGKLIGQVSSSPYDLIWGTLINKIYYDGFFAISESKNGIGYFTITGKIAFSKDGNSLVIGCVIVNSSNGQLIKKLANCQDNEYINALSFGENYLARGDTYFAQHTNGEHFLAGDLKLWNSLTGELLIDQQFPFGIYSISFSANNNSLAVGTDYISLWDTKTNKLIRNFYPATGRVEYVGFQNNDQQLIVVTVPNYLISKFDIKSGKLLALIRPTLPDDIYPYSHVYIMGNKMITSGTISEIGKDSTSIRFNYGDNWSALPIVTSDERVLIRLDTELSFIDTKTGKELYKSNTPILSYPIISPDQKHIAFLAPGGTIQIWDISRILELATH